jgi:hypothetical protein
VLEYLRTKVQNDAMNLILSKELVNGRVDVTGSPDNSPELGAKLLHTDQFRVLQPMSMRLICTAIYFCIMMLSYFIMLLVMSFNVGIFVTVVIGFTVGTTVLPKPTEICEYNPEMSVISSVYRPDCDKCCVSANDCCKFSSCPMTSP